MGASQSIQKINFEDIQSVIKNSDSYLLINTLPSLEQNCLIINTIPCDQEEEIINRYIKNTTHIKQSVIKIVIYGRNCNDDKIYQKYNQLITLGFYNVFIYIGGLFEWLLLQDIYGLELFPTTTPAKDMLKYKQPRKLNLSLLEY
jgi:hypothetical protein